MRKCFVLTALVFMQAALFGQEIDTLDQAINDSMAYIIDRLGPGTRVAINFDASPAITKYVIEKMNAFLAKNGNLTVVARSPEELKVLQAEIDFQQSGQVSLESAQETEEKLGAQTIITGSLTPFGNMWRMHIRALKVETAERQGEKEYTIRKDRALSRLIPKTTGEKAGTGALNIVFGLGSYLEGDLAGGLTITAGYVVAAGLFIFEAAALDWDSPAVGIPATIGVAAAGLTIAYGFARPFIYNRNPPMVAVLDNVHVNIVPAADNGFGTPGRPGVRLAYSLKF